jgi:hypothetical protein
MQFLNLPLSVTFIANLPLQGDVPAIEMSNATSSGNGSTGKEDRQTTQTNLSLEQPIV